MGIYLEGEGYGMFGRHYEFFTNENFRNKVFPNIFSLNAYLKEKN